MWNIYIYLYIHDPTFNVSYTILIRNDLYGIQMDSAILMPPESHLQLETWGVITEGT